MFLELFPLSGKIKILPSHFIILHYTGIYVNIPDSSVGIATGYWLDGRGLIPNKNK
jgi:hypothetical protein